MIRKIQEGIETEEQLSKGLVKGISDAFSKSIEPFVTESICTRSHYRYLCERWSDKRR